MRLSKLTIAGVRSFSTETSIDFERLSACGLFAIVGPTGAGKSTILDAIFLALFGRTPRGEASECVSPTATTMFVRLELRVAEDRELSVTRIWQWAKKRGISDAHGSIRGTPKHPPLRLEERVNGGAWTPLDIGGQKAEQYVRNEIVKIKMADFQQAVVLPQGEFDALLRARPADRRTLVASLFRTEHLGAPLMDVLRERERSIANEMARTEDILREISITEEDFAALVSTQSELAHRAEELRKAATVAQNTAKEQQWAHERCVAREIAQAELSKIEAELGLFEAQRLRLEVAERARAAFPLVSEMHVAREEHDTLLNAHAKTRHEAEDAKRTQQTLEEALLEATKRHELELPANAVRQSKVELAVSRVVARSQRLHERQQKRIELEQHDAAVAAGTEAERAHGLRAREAFFAAEELRSLLSRTRVREEERLQAHARKAVFEMQSEVQHEQDVFSAELERERRSEAELSVRLKEAEDQASQLEHEQVSLEARRAALMVDSERARALEERLERDLHERSLSEAAHTLAKELRRGTACPVCGSIEHPSPSQGPTKADADLEEARRSRHQTDKALEEATRALTEASELLRVETDRIESISGALHRTLKRIAVLESRDGDLPPLLSAARERAQKRRRATLEMLSTFDASQREQLLKEACSENEIRSLQADLAERDRRTEELLEEITKAEKVNAESEGVQRRLVDEVRPRREKRDLVASELRALEVTLSIEAAELNELLEAPIELTDGLDAEECERLVQVLHSERQALIEKKERIEREVLANRLALSKARDATRALSIREADLLARVENARTRLSESLSKGERALRESGFVSVDDLRRAILDDAELEELRGRLDRLLAELSRARTVLEERTRLVQKEVTEENAKASMDYARALETEAHSAMEKAMDGRFRVDEGKRRLERTRELAEKVNGLRPRAARLAAIRQVVGSNQLSELAAEHHLESVMASASELLLEMTRRRFTLERSSDGSFSIADAIHGGILRSPATLSGGESFLVSLALALSLSFRIQLAGRTRFDFFFLDEGFGSLDADSLELVLSALERIRGQHRVIGMISHVLSLEERMPRKLHVTPDRKGGAKVSYSP